MFPVFTGVRRLANVHTPHAKATERDLPSLLARRAPGKQLHLHMPPREKQKEKGSGEQVKNKGMTRSKGNKIMCCCSVMVLTTAIVAMQLGITRAQHEGHLISRLNVGTIFRRLDRKIYSSAKWRQTFVIEFPKPGTGFNRQAVKCLMSNGSSVEITEANVNAYCRQLSDLILINNYRETLYTGINKTWREIRDIFPEDGQNNKRFDRTKRGLFSAIGSFLGNIFGLPSSSDLRVLETHLGILRDNNAKVRQVTFDLTDTLSAYMTVSNKRFKSLQESLIKDHERVQTQIRDLQEGLLTEIAITRILAKYALYFSADLYNTQILLTNLIEFAESIHLLLDGKLCPTLLPLKILFETVDWIDEELAKRKIDLEVAQFTMASIYRDTPFLWSYLNNSIAIQMSFPLVKRSKATFTIYETIVFPIPFGSSQNLTTKITQMPKYIAFSDDQSTYCIPEARELKEPFMDAEIHDLPLSEVDNSKSCAVAVFFDSVTDIKKFCDFKVIEGPPSPMVQYLGSSDYLLKDIEQVYKFCPEDEPGTDVKNTRHTAMRVNEKTIVLHLPCLCEIKINNKIYLPQTSGCERNLTLAKSYPINLALVMWFYGTEKYPDISAGTLRDEQPTVHMPEITIERSHLAEVLAKDREVSVSLQAMAEKVKSNQKIFATLSEPILQNIADMQRPENTLLTAAGVLSLINMVLLSIIVAVITYVLFRLHGIAGILAFLQQIPITKAAVVLGSTPVTVTDNDGSTWNKIMIEYHVFYVLIGIAVTIILGIILKLLAGLRRHAELSLQFSDGRECVRVHLMYTQVCPSYFHCQANKRFENIEVRGQWRPTVQWDPNGMVLIHLHSQVRTTMPDEVPISIISANRLRRIMNRPYCAFLLAKHNGITSSMKICLDDCDICGLPWVKDPKDCAPIEMVNTEIRQMYPDLSHMEVTKV